MPDTLMRWYRTLVAQKWTYTHRRVAEAFRSPRKRVSASGKNTDRQPPAVDRLAALLDRFRVRAALFHSGALCGNNKFEAMPGRAFLHVLRRGEMEVRHPKNSGLLRKFSVAEPTLLLYSRPIEHIFINPPRDGSDFTCATLQ